MSIEDTAEHIVARLDELPRSERVRYMETFLDRVKQRAVSRETLDEAKHRALDEARDNDRLRRERDALIEERDIARAERQGADAKAEAMQGERDEAVERAEQAEKRLASYRDIARERERADAWRNIASDAIDTLWAIINGNSSEWAKGKLESLRKRGQELMP